MGTGAASANPSFDFVRIAGEDRYATSAEVAAEFGQSTEAILASGQEGHFPDALTANYLAGELQAPVLLTRHNSTPDAVLAALEDMGAERITLIGDTNAVSAAQADALRKAGYEVRRLAGDNRYTTNVEVIEDGTTDNDTALVTTGLKFPDALAGGPLSFAADMPLAITRPTAMHDAVLDALLDEGITEAIVLGGTDSVGPEVVEQLETAGITVTMRLAGADRAETAAEVARYAVAELGFSTSTVNVASGAPSLDGADALSAGPLSGQQKTPLLVTRDTDTPGTGLLGFLFEHSATLVSGQIIGGAPSVTTAARNEMRSVALGTSADFTLTLIHSNDMESQLLGVDIGDVDGDGDEDGDLDNDGRLDYGGVDRFAALVDQIRQQATTGAPTGGDAAQRGSALVSAGDNFLAGPEFSASLDADGTAGNPIYDAEAMQLMGYDLSAIGNHDFDFGPELLAEFINAVDGAFPFVSANLDFSAEPSLQSLVESGEIVQHYVVETGGDKVGFIGLTTPQLPTISSPRGVTVSDELVKITQEHVAALEAEGINKIVLVSHLQNIENERALATELNDVDVIIGGGGGELIANNDDTLIPGEARNIDPATGQPYYYPILAKDADGTTVPIVTTPGDWRYVGELVVTFDENGDLIPGSWAPKSGPVRVSGVGDDAVTPDPEVKAQVFDPVSAHVAELQETVVATSDVPLNGVREEVRTRETNVGALLADALLATGQAQAAEFDVEAPQIAIQNGGGIRNDSEIPAGEVTAFDTYSIAPFANFVAVQPDVPCVNIKALLERGVSTLPEAGGQFTQVAGLHFTYDVSRQAQVVDETTGEILTEGQRVRSVTLLGEDGQFGTADDVVVVEDGQIVAGCEPITLATNDFSARGGDAYPLGEFPFTIVGKTYQAALQDYLTDNLGGTITAEQYSKEAVSVRIQPVS